ncbi:MAG TPA: FtsX-like permease family protein, partial [Gemmatimonadota bacterium]|nr:FtsX-like permease family protein [Gemmatimonadota bacterium]
RREMSLRSALGASRARLARQLLVESLALGAVGALLGLGLAILAAGVIPQILPASLGVADLPLDHRVVGSAILLALFVSLASGTAPALRAARVDVAGALREVSRGSAGRGGVRARESLVAFQTALAVSLLIGAGLLAKSLLGLSAVDPGFDPRGAVGMRVDLPGQSYGERERQSAFYRELTARVRTLPGVSATGVVSALPLSGSYHTEGADVVGGPPPDPLPLVDVYAVSPGYRAAMRIELSAGRDFDGRDRKDAAPVAMVDETFVSRYLPDGRPVGRRIRLDGHEGEWTIVGVVHHVKQRRLDADGMGQVYVPLGQAPERFMSLVVRGEGGAAPPVAAIRRTVGRIDPAVAVATVEGLDGLVAGSLGDRRFPLWVLGTFSALALVLTAVGLAGLTAFVVRRRRRELAIRMALGASPSDVVGLVLRRGAVLVAGGATIGLALGLAGGRLLSGLLYQVSPADPEVFVEIVLVVGTTALLAAWLPARRAAGVRPGSALRAE